MPDRAHEEGRVSAHREPRLVVDISPAAALKSGHRRRCGRRLSKEPERTAMVSRRRWPNNVILTPHIGRPKAQEAWQKKSPRR
jgi:hypothetical protein